MSLIANITSDDAWHVGEDKILDYTIYGDAARTTCLDVSAFVLSWKLSRGGTTGLVTKTSGSGITVAGTFNADPAVNTQVVRVAIDDVDTQPDTGPALTSGNYVHELKRTDAGLEAVLSHGRVQLLPSLHAV